MSRNRTEPRFLRLLLIGRLNLMAFRWRADDGPLLVVFGSSLSPSPHQLKKCQSWTPIIIHLIPCVCVCLGKCTFTHKETFRPIRRLLVWSGPEVIKLFSCSTQMSKKFQLLMKTKIPRNNCWHFNIYEQDKFCAQLS